MALGLVTMGPLVSTSTLGPGPLGDGTPSAWPWGPPPTPLPLTTWGNVCRAKGSGNNFVLEFELVFRFQTSNLPVSGHLRTWLSLTHKVPFMPQRWHKISFRLCPEILLTGAWNGPLWYIKGPQLYPFLVLWYFNIWPVEVLSLQSTEHLFMLLVRSLLLLQWWEG